MKVRMSCDKEDYDSVYDWSCFCQGGDNGVVFSKKGNYNTAFFEAFPDDPKCFLRGEGKNIQEAEQAAWNKYQKILVCNHEMERRGRTDGYAYCKHCSYASTVFEPLTKCCKCGVPTAYASDYRGKHYCKKHSRVMPKDPNPSRVSRLRENGKKLPRKYKKSLKKAAECVFQYNKIFEKVFLRGVYKCKFTCGEMQIVLFFKKDFKSLLKAGEMNKNLIRLAKKRKTANNA